MDSKRIKGFMIKTAYEISTASFNLKSKALKDAFDKTWPVNCMWYQTQANPLRL